MKSTIESPVYFHSNVSEYAADPNNRSNQVFGCHAAPAWRASRQCPARQALSMLSGCLCFLKWQRTEPRSLLFMPGLLHRLAGQPENPVYQEMP